MPDTRPVSNVDQFLLNHGYEPTTPVRDVVQRQPQPQPHVPNPNRFGPSGRYFINDAQLDGRPRTSVVEAGVSGMSVENPLPDRDTFESEMAKRTELAREVEKLNRASGSHTISNARSRAREGWESHLVRDRFSGRLTETWSRVGSDLARDPAGRPSPATSVDRGDFVPGADIF